MTTEIECPFGGICPVNCPKRDVAEAYTHEVQKRMSVSPSTPQEAKKQKADMRAIRVGAKGAASGGCIQQQKFL